MFIEVAKQAMWYYTQVTGKEYTSFLENMDRVLQTPLEEQTGEDWLLHSLLQTIEYYGGSVEALKKRKDNSIY